MCLLLGYVNIFLLFFVVTLGFKVDTSIAYDYSALITRTGIT